jgi:hypothetical protein
VLVSCALEVKPTPPAVRAYAVDIVLINHGRASLLPWLNATAEGDTAFPQVPARLATSAALARQPDGSICPRARSGRRRWRRSCQTQPWTCRADQ